MGIGTLEIVLFVVAIVGTLAGVFLTKNRYLLGVIGFFAIAALASPPDPFSMLLFALPSACLYVFAVQNQRRPVMR